MKLLFAVGARLHVLRPETAKRSGGFVLAANHISHFDPFLISIVVSRKIDWLTMAGFFRNPLLGFLLRAINAFPAERNRAEISTIRAAVERLRNGRVVGLFPEGGIRDGARSVLEGAPARRGAAALACIAGVPVVPCVILGSDRLYSWSSWLPFRRASVWIAFGNPIAQFPDLPKAGARERIDVELSVAFKNLCVELRENFHLTRDDLPQSPRARMQMPACRSLGLPQPLPRKESSAKDSLHTGVFRNRGLRGLAARSVDSLICELLNLVHRRHRLNSRSLEQMERYVAKCERLAPQDYYAAPPENAPVNEGPLLDGASDSRRTIVRWPSPVKTLFPENNIAHAEFFPSAKGHTAPTVFLLHSLMSASQTGYRRWALHFNEKGWNACFVHLPYHYSRSPRGYLNGELAITPDLLRNAEALRQSVIELRQLMSALRKRGCREFGVLATSYGAWIGALLTTAERDFRFVALMSPIVNVEHAIWQSPAAHFIRRELRRAKIEPDLVARHFHLSSPLHAKLLCDPARIVFASGEFDFIAPPEQIEAIHRKWRGSHLLRVRQGHFGYRMMRETVAHLEQRGAW
jgi:1-acyl-sn-glycerol-3-phosphate acyltransferase